MFETRDGNDPEQNELWVQSKKLPKASPDPFYRKLDKTLSELGFTEDVREICRPAYAHEEKGGRPGIDPVVYFSKRKERHFLVHALILQWCLRAIVIVLNLCVLVSCFTEKFSCY